MNLFDAHCHLQDERLAPDLDGAMQRAAQVGVQRFLCCGSSEEDWPQVAALCGKYSGVLPAFGLHPWYVRDRSTEWLAHLTRALSDTSAVVGEIGLDHAVDPRNDEEQESVFIAQLHLARQLNRPAAIHCRRAWEHLLAVLKKTGPLPRGFMIHSYSGGHELIKPLAELGAYFSFSGSITRSGNRRGHHAAREVPADRLLIETDAPDLSPVIRDGDRTSEPAVNEPANLQYIVAALAELRGTDSNQIAELTRNNACRLYGVTN